MSSMWISMWMRMRRCMRMTRVRGRRWPLIEVRIILIHHLGAAHHTPRTRHPRAGLPTSVPERCTRVTRARNFLHAPLFSSGNKLKIVLLSQRLLIPYIFFSPRLKTIAISQLLFSCRTANHYQKMIIAVHSSSFHFCLFIITLTIYNHWLNNLSPDG